MPVEAPNLEGRVFGSWRVLSSVYARRSKYSDTQKRRICWVCECTCGSGITKIIYPGALVSGDSKGCEVCHKVRWRESFEKRRLDFIGRTFGKWVVRSFAGKHKTALEWWCECTSCGLGYRKQTVTLISGRSKSCMKCGGVVRRAKPFMHLYYQMRTRVKDLTRCRRRSGRPFDAKTTISFKDFLEFTKINECHYCGRGIVWAAYHQDGLGQAYNLDRKDSSKGYETGNLVVCCQPCNWAKGSQLSYEEMVVIGNLRRLKRLHDETPLEMAA